MGDGGERGFGDNHIQPALGMDFSSPKEKQELDFGSGIPWVFHPILQFCHSAD